MQGENDDDDIMIHLLKNNNNNNISIGQKYDLIAWLQRLKK